MATGRGDVACMYICVYVYVVGLHCKGYMCIRYLYVWRGWGRPVWLYVALYVRTAVNSGMGMMVLYV